MESFGSVFLGQQVKPYFILHVARNERFFQHSHRKSIYNLFRGLKELQIGASFSSAFQHFVKNSHPIHGP